MPKKATTAHRRAQYTKPKVQKSFELVRPEKTVSEVDANDTTTSIRTSTASTDPAESKTSARASTAVTDPAESKTVEKASTAVSTKEEQETKTQEAPNAPVPGSASARLAARRQAAQKLQQRSAATLITSEHFAYVRADLIRITIFAAVMFTAIIVLYFMLGRA